MHARAANKLRVTLARMTRGEVGMRLMVWRHAAHRARLFGEVPTLKQEVIGLKAALAQRDGKIEAVLGEVSLLGRAMNTNREELEVRLEKQWAGVGQAMDMLGTALNLREPLLHHLHQKDRRSPNREAALSPRSSPPPSASSGLDRFGRF